MTIKEAYGSLIYSISAELYEISEAKNISRIVFEDLFKLNVDGDDVFEEEERLTEVKMRLLAGEPVQYITGKAVFFEYDLKVNNRVLIPRPETEELVFWIVEDFKNSRLQLDVLDVGTGSGCVSIALKKKMPFMRMFGIEYSIDALNVSRINAKRLGAQIHYYRIDFLNKKGWPYLGMFDLVVSNPPYIHKDQKPLMANNVLKYEPEMALFAEGKDALIFYKRIREFCDIHLANGGRIYLEINEFYADEIISIFKGDRVESIEVRNDLQDKKRMMRIIYT